MPDIETEQHSSWGEAVRAYDASRKTLSWKKDEFKPVEKLSHYERKVKEREVDPLTMTYRDPIKEENRLLNRTNKLNNTLDRYNNELLSHRNIINNTGGPYRPPREPRSSVIPRDNHIITNVSIKDYKNISFYFNEDYVENHRATKVPHKHAKADSREFNILNNRYFKNHNGRTEKEYLELRDTVKERYWKDRDFNPITQKYYNHNKEDNYKSQLNFVQTIQGKAKQLRLPPSIQYSEGEAYNIINGSSDNSDDTKLQASQTLLLRTQNRQKKNKIEKLQLENGNNDYNNKQNQKLNRISFKRYEEEYNRGYSIIKSGNFPSFNGATINVKRPNSIWDTIGGGDGKRHDNYNNNNNNNNDYNNNNSFSARSSPSKPMTSVRHDMNTNTSRTSRGSSLSVPALDLTKTQGRQDVSYKEPKDGPPGMPVPMSVRTGGRL